MEYRNLGRTGLKVSNLCLGTMNFGPRTSQPDSFAIMDKALEMGFNFYDTANVYGGQDAKGHTEEIVGRWLAQGGRRDRIVLATKVFGNMGPGPNDRGLSAYNIRKACEDSLRRLQTDHIDLYQMHHVERTTPWDEIFQAMETLVSAGQRSSMSAAATSPAWDIATANVIAFNRHFLGLVSEQSVYNLANRTVELEVLPCCQSLGLGVIPVEPAGGRTAGRRAAGDRGWPAGRRRYEDPDRKAPVEPGAVGETVRRTAGRPRQRRPGLAAA